MLATLGGLVYSRSYAADDAWPTMPITLTVPFSAGGGTDLLARTLAQQLSTKWNASVIVENKPGAAGNIGAEVVARDQTRHRLLFTTASISVNQTLYKNLAFALGKDLLPVSMLTSSPLVLTVPGSSTVKSVDDLLAQAKSTAGGLNYGSPGIGTTSHLGCAVLSNTLGFKATHIPYKGAGQVLTALIGKEIDFSMLAAVAAAPHLRSGALRAIGIAGRTTPPGMDGIPLLTERNPTIDFDNWQALFAPASLPQSDIDKLYGAMNEILKTPDVVHKINLDGATPLGLSPAETAQKVATEVQRYKSIVEQFNITVL
ncbi:MAG TPA: tripartite tricarboxylate transporter substrate binding protein [Bordetella sp.]|jgi:tripartite-type tricarboxylate transporter receptor subunit TctC|nr:tripartite tricarboxylate transporter substrate binding protein [Bordetella sp.]